MLYALCHVSQTSLLEACKSVASSLSDLLNSSKNASGKPPTSAEMEALRLEAKVSNVLFLILFCILFGLTVLWLPV